MNNHIPVLLNEAVNLLNIKENGIYVDCTLGRAGHSAEILKKLKSGKLYCFEQDQDAINASEIILKKIGQNFKIIKSNFKNLEAELSLHNVKQVDGILYDLGISSPQFDVAKRGFSYRYNNRLDMRMDQTQKLTAWDVVNTYSLAKLNKIFREYGEEKFSYQIAKNIIKHKTLKNINTTFELVDVIKQSLSQKILKVKKHPARKVFQAIRIEVNDEINVLEKSLKQALTLLNKGGVIVVISFHSLEDRLVKSIFKQALVNPDEEINKKIPIIKKWTPEYELLNKKIIQASEDELKKNKRSRSAKLRAIVKK